MIVSTSFGTHVTHLITYELSQVAVHALHPATHNQSVLRWQDQTGARWETF